MEVAHVMRRALFLPGSAVSTNFRLSSFFLWLREAYVRCSSMWRRVMPSALRLNVLL